MDAATWLPLVFAGLMGLAMLVYVVLDGYDLGVGILMADADDAQKDRMIASLLSEGRTAPDPTEQLSSLGLSSRFPPLNGLPGPLAAELVLQLA